jgi:hypothetical protein
MNTIRRILSASILAVAACGLASANSIAGTCTTISAPTELASASLTCSKLDTSTIPLTAVITSIDLTINGEITGSIRLTNNAGTTQLVSGTTNSNFFGSALAGFSFTSPLFNPSFTTGFQSLTAADSVLFSGLDSGLVSETRTNTTNFAPYLGIGNFAISFSTISGFNLTGGGGQVASAQTTNAFASAAVTYNYTIPSGTPEPATMLLFGSALVGLGVYRRRLKN